LEAAFWIVRTALKPGPWDEAALWLCGNAAKPTKRESGDREPAYSVSSTAGYHRIGTENSWALVRAGGTPDVLFKPINCTWTCGGTASIWRGMRGHISTMASLPGTTGLPARRSQHGQWWIAATRCGAPAVFSGWMGAGVGQIFLHVFIAISPETIADSPKLF